MRITLFCLLATGLLQLSGCNKADASDMNIGDPTPLGSAERIDRIQYLGNASSAVTRAEDAYRHQKPAGADLDDAVRLIGLALRSSTEGHAPVEANWESQVASALGQVKQGMENHNPPVIEDGLNKVKIYIDQAQQAASIEY